MNNKFFFSLVVLLSAPSLHGMENTQQNESEQKTSAIQKLAQAAEPDSSVDAEIAHLSYVLQRSQIHEQMEEARKFKVFSFQQIEWLAKACKEFHMNRLENEETKSYTLNTVATLEEILKKLKLIHTLLNI